MDVQLILLNASCVNEKKSPLFLLLILHPELVNGMDATFDAGFQTSAELVDATELFRIRQESGLGGQKRPSFSNI
jgi:hypothetical protein